MTRPRLERYRRTFLSYFNDHVLAAEFDEQQNLIVYATPYYDFDKVIIEVCAGLMETVDFSDHLFLHLYPFGSNHYVKIGIN
jgi:hypothetical protein